ncbi:MAG: aminotransferase class I/II-fold pyridoxal phosphate-dependent enzyme [Pedosphaera sp.]|nr:aminotransferase class I/II-fold pyridoxal phosphate-dependent enzyme [Pedosphaera sp.]
MPKNVTHPKSPAAFVRPLVRGLHAYTPGEQPKIRGLIKLNTNENPYPPSPKVLKCVRDAVDDRLRLYPDPTAEPLRWALATLHNCTPENIIVGNGSDELLALAVRTFVEPARESLPENLPSSTSQKKGSRQPRDSKNRVQFFAPSYSLYPVLAESHGALPHPVPLADNFTIPTIAQLKRSGLWDFRAALSLITTPNAPSGRGYTTDELNVLCNAQKGITILDEAYVDFAQENALELPFRHSHVLVSRTFSKAYSLCFQRVGYFIAHPELISALHRMRDSYNVNGLGQIAAVATLADLPYYRQNFSKIRGSRQRLSDALTDFGWSVLPSETNFILTRPTGPTAREWLEALRSHRILVRWFATAGLEGFLRITVGTDAEVDRLLKAIRTLIRTQKRH